jgi:hypothetical protein
MAIFHPIVDFSPAHRLLRFCTCICSEDLLCETIVLCCDEVECVATLWYVAATQRQWLVSQKAKYHTVDMVPIPVRPCLNRACLPVDAARDTVCCLLTVTVC